MKKISTVAELKSVCAEIKKDGGKEYVSLALTEPVVDFLLSIYGKNRPEVAIQVAALYSTIKSGDWDSNQSAITINASCNWLCSGHHRVIAIKHAGDFSLEVDVQILQDSDAERKFLKDDTLIATRTSAQQANMFLGVQLAQSCNCIMKAIEEMRGNFGAKFGPKEIARFNDEHDNFLRAHHITSTCIRAGRRTAKIPRVFYALYFFLMDGCKTELANRALRLIDEVANENTLHEQARLIREFVLTSGQGDRSESIPIFYKAVVKGDLPRSKSYVRHNEIDGIKEALGIVNSANSKKFASKGSRNYFKNVIREIKGV